MSFSEEPRSYADTRKRSSAEYVKFSPQYRVVLRMLNPKARTVWKHWIKQANNGRGLGVVCPNIEARMDACPIEREYGNRPRDDEDRKENIARRKFVVNVLDRTPYTTCRACNTQTPGVQKTAGTTKQCISCGADLKGHDFEPLNRVKILEQGPKLFNESLNAISDMQMQDLGVDITGYDITFTAQGEGRDRRITAIPQTPTELPEDALVDPETGEPQKLFDLDLLAEPATSEEIELLLEGGTIDQLNALRGVV